MMRVSFLEEPELEFGGGVRHIDVRFGLMHAGPLDVLSPATRSISVAVVGTNESIEGLAGWLDRCRGEISAKEGPYPNLFPRFPGFRPDVAFRSTLQLNARSQRTIPQKEISRLLKIGRPKDLVKETVHLFIEEMRYATETANTDVLICAPPFDLMEVIKSTEPPAREGDGEDLGDGNGDEEEDETEYAGAHLEFHDLLKARGMSLRAPIQLVWPPTYDPSKRRRQKRRAGLFRGLQDEATRAWNIHTALYYKAGGIPWRLVRDPTQLTSCCIGISFYKSIDGDRLQTSVAQVFNERGDGVIVRGGQAAISKEDRQPHLDEAGAKALLASALATYKREHKNLPARLVLHKSSRYSDQELSGFQAAADAAMVEEADFLSLGTSFVRLFREEEYPPLRGTMLSLDDQTHVLYTNGSVDFFGTYPGMYVPLPLLLRSEDTAQTPRFLAQEVLSLTKMNWNNTRFDGKEPIALHAARQVGSILRYVGSGDPIVPSYSYYM